MNRSPFEASYEAGKAYLESDRAFVIWDIYPVSKGHSLIVPKTRVSNFFDLALEDQQACIELLNKAKEKLTVEYEPDGFNVGINIGQAAGQTVDHVHIHLIPRYAGDVSNPVGGIRNVIPGMGDYLNPTS